MPDFNEPIPEEETLPKGVARAFYRLLGQQERIIKDQEVANEQREDMQSQLHILKHDSNNLTMSVRELPNFLEKQTEKITKTLSDKIDHEIDKKVSIVQKTVQTELNTNMSQLREQVKQDITYRVTEVIRAELKDFNTQFVRVESFNPVKAVVFGLVAAILVAVIGAILGGVISK